MQNSIENDAAAAPANPTVTPVFMYPCFSGAPGLIKFNGKTSAISLSEWKATLQTMFNVQYIPVTHQVDLVLSGLEGEAKREILILPIEQRNTVKLIFDKLDELYGDRLPASVLRSLYFSCTQEARETTRTFALRLQELFRRLQNRDPRGIGNEDVLLRDQFVDGLRDTTLRRELRTKLLLQEGLTFAQVRQEVLARVEVYGEEEIPAQSYAVQQSNPLVQPSAAPRLHSPVQSYVSNQANPVTLDLQQMKDDMQKELMSEFREQFTSLSRELIQEVRGGWHQPSPRKLDNHLRTSHEPYTAPQHSLPRREEYGGPRQQGHWRTSHPFDDPPYYPQQGAEISYNHQQPRGGEYSTSRRNGRWQRPSNSVCNYCNKKGHTQHQCRARENDSHQQQPLN